jgi:hypothetical protein
MPTAGALAKAEAGAERRKAEFEVQLARIYHVDEDAVSQAARKAAEQAVRQANERVAQTRRPEVTGLERRWTLRTLNAS